MKKSKEAFTLLELLIAVTIFSIAAVALYSSFYVGIRILRRSEEATRLHQELRLVTEEISLDLRNSLFFPLKEEVGEAAAVEEEEAPIYFFLGEEDRFIFVTLRDTFFETGKLKREICNITYYLKEGEGGKELMRITKYQRRGFQTTPDEEETLLTGIEDMELLYSFEGEDEDLPPIWLDRWEAEEKIPLGVKIKLKLKGLGALREFDKTVFIPVGTLGVLEESEEL